MRKFNVTEEMAKGFAAEIDNNIEKMSKKGGMPFLNYVLNMKSGKAEKVNDEMEKVSISVSLLCPIGIKAIHGKFRRVYIILKNGKCRWESAMGILNMVVDAVESYEYHLAEYKNDSMLCYKDAFKEVVEQYGFEDLERRIAEFFAYLEGLAVSESKESVPVSEQQSAEVNATPSLVESLFNEIKEQIDDLVVTEKEVGTRAFSSEYLVMWALFGMNWAKSDKYKNYDNEVLDGLATMASKYYKKGLQNQAIAKWKELNPGSMTKEQKARVWKVYKMALENRWEMDRRLAELSVSEYDTMDFDDDSAEVADAPILSESEICPATDEGGVESGVETFETWSDEDDLDENLIEAFNDYMKNVVAENFKSCISSLEEWGDELGGEDAGCTFNYEFDYEQEWLNYIASFAEINVSLESASEFYRANQDKFINADDMVKYIYSIEDDYNAWTNDHSCEECFVWIKNPYYVAPKTESEIVAEVVAVVKANLLENYKEGQKLDWSLFDDETMEYLFEHGADVYDKIICAVPQISDCLAYDDCFYMWYDDMPERENMHPTPTPTCSEICPATDERGVESGHESENISLNRKVIYKNEFTYITQNVMFNGASTDWDNIIFLLEGLKENIDSEFFPHTSEWVDILISNAKVAKRKNCSYDKMITSIMSFAYFYQNMANIMGLDENINE